MIVFVHAHDFDIIDMKSFVKLPNRLHPLYSNKEMKSFFFTLFPHSLASRSYRDITYGIRA